MNRRRFLRIVAAAAAVSPSARAAARVSSWLAGAASLDITPERSLWMAGFARRTQPSQGVALPLRAKALALQHRDGRPVVLVTVDLLGVTARLTDRVAAELQRLHGVRRAEILFNASHALRPGCRRTAVGRVRSWREQNRCPQNERLCSEAIWMGQTMLLGPRQDMEDIAAAVRKVQAHAVSLAREGSA